MSGVSAATREKTEPQGQALGRNSGEMIQDCPVMRIGCHSADRQLCVYWQEKARETNNVCEAILTRVIGLLQTHYMSLRELVRGQEEVAIQTLERRKEEVKMRCTALDRLAHTDSDVHFLLVCVHTAYIFLYSSLSLQSLPFTGMAHSPSTLWERSPQVYRQSTSSFWVYTKGCWASGESAWRVMRQWICHNQSDRCVLL